MKYETLENKFKTREEAIRMAVRISQCKPFIRQAINEWLETEVSPTLTVAAKPGWGNGKEWEFSAEDLMIGYGMHPLDALLFLDWLIADDESCKNALMYLDHPSTPHRLEMTQDELLAKLKPEVRKLSEALLKKRKQNYDRLERYYNEKLKGKEIYHD